MVKCANCRGELIKFGSSYICNKCGLDFNEKEIHLLKWIKRDYNELADEIIGLKNENALQNNQLGAIFNLIKEEKNTLKTPDVVTLFPEHAQAIQLMKILFQKKEEENRVNTNETITIDMANADYKSKIVPIHFEIWKDKQDSLKNGIKEKENVVNEHLFQEGVERTKDIIIEWIKNYVEIVRNSEDVLNTVKDVLITERDSIINGIIKLEIKK